MKKKLVLIILVLLILLLFICIIIKGNNKNKISETQIVHDITFLDSKISKKKNKYILSVKIKNNKNIKVKRFQADIKDKKGNTIDVLESNFNNNEIQKYKLESSKNLRKAYQISYSIYNQ